MYLYVEGLYVGQVHMSISQCVYKVPRLVVDDVMMTS